MDLFTAQLCRWRRIKEMDIELIDVSIKSGNAAFAPTYKLLIPYKDGTISEEEYAKQYRELMLRSYMTNQILWNNLVQKERIAIACYCTPGTFCHRHLLIRYIEKICLSSDIPFNYVGEIE
jgi:hypothetical protein